MRKIIIVLASIVTLFLVAAILIPIFYKDDIQQSVRQVLQENLEAKVYFEPSKFGLTLFKSFPNPTASLEDFGIVGLNLFEGDTLVSVKSFDITIDLFSLFGDTYTVKSINLVKPMLNVIVLKNGEANYEIVAEAEDTQAEEENSSAFSLLIDQWNISDGRLVYEDKSMDYSMFLGGLNHSGSGNISLDVYDLKTLTTIENAVVTYDGVNYLNGQKISADAKININMPEFKFTFMNNEIKVNDFPVSFDGYFSMPSDDMEMDITFASTSGSIKSLYSLIPGVYTEEYQSVKAEGEMNFSGFVRGIYNDISMPAFQLVLQASEGMISYPELPMPIKNINLDMLVDCKDGNIDNTFIEIKQMHMDMGSNPIDGSLVIRNLVDYSMKADIEAKLDLEELTSIFPVEGLDMKGVFALKLNADGIYDSIKNIMPAITASMRMDNGYIKSSDFPRPLESMSFKAELDASSGKMEDLLLKVDNFSMTMEGEKLTGNLLLKDMVDYQWDLFVKGGLDLEIFSQIYPIEGMKYSGHLLADIETRGKYSDVEGGHYNRFPTKGKVVLEEFAFESVDLPQGMNIKESTISMDPAKLQVDSFDGTIGKSDLKMNGFVSNYIEYVFQENAALVGKMSLNSNVLDVNEWMTGEATTIASSESEMKMETVIIPRNIDFEFNSSINNIYYDNLHLQNAKGLLTVRDGILDMNDLSFNMLGGEIAMNGKYDTRLEDKPLFNYKLIINSLSIPQAFSSFSTVQAFAPFAQHMNGNFSTNFNISGMLKEDMTPVYESLNGKGLIQIAEAFFKESKLVSGISEFIKSDNRSSQLSLKDVLMKASLENGRAHVSPFDIVLGGQKANIYGSIGADGSLDYYLSTEVEAGMVGQQVNQLLAGFKGQDAASANSKIKLNFNVGGTYEKPVFTLAGTTNSDGTKITIKNEVKQEINTRIDSTKQEAEKMVQSETKKLMENGEEQLQQQLDTLKKELTKDLKDDAGKILGDELDSTANELKKSIQSIFKKKKKN